MFSIKGWHKFQHFKDRRPPWIKLYRDLLDDADWFDLSDKDSKTLVMLWLIASEQEGELPCLRKLSFRLRMKEADVSASLQRLSHFLIQSDISVISERYQDDAPETERETETETETDYAAACAAHGQQEEKQGQAKKEAKQASTPLPMGSLSATPSELAERELFSVAKQAMGKSCGGLISSLIRHHNYDLTAARRIVDIAITKSDPREYLVATMRSNANGRGGSVLAAGERIDAELRARGATGSYIPGTGSPEPLNEIRGENAVDQSVRSNGLWLVSKG